MTTISVIHIASSARITLITVACYGRLVDTEYHLKGLADVTNFQSISVPLFACLELSIGTRLPVIRMTFRFLQDTARRRLGSTGTTSKRIYPTTMPTAIPTDEPESHLNVIDQLFSRSSPRRALSTGERRSFSLVRFLALATFDCVPRVPTFLSSFLLATH